MMADEQTTVSKKNSPIANTKGQVTETYGEAAPLAKLVNDANDSFDNWGLCDDLREGLRDMGYIQPMPVQSSVFKTLSAGQDLMVQSKTGSGKTAAFGIPVVHRLAGSPKGLQALILAPTRELALQVGREIEQIAARMHVTVVPVYGGAPINPQISALKAGAQIVAGTPGRVLDHIRRKTLDPSTIQMLVLDECDEMLSMGFQEEIEAIISTLPGKESRQTLLFSATIPPEIERIGRRHMRDPETICLSSDNVGAEHIDHYYYVVSGMARTRDLLRVLSAEKPESAIIFCNTREETTTVARYLCRHGYDAEALSSDLSQKDRERVMGRMRAKNLNFLVATDIAARGIDISDLTHVIHYTFPPSPEVYVHRSGRTGRAGQAGTALSLVGPREIGAFYHLKLIYKIIPIERDLPSMEEMAVLAAQRDAKKLIDTIPDKPKDKYAVLLEQLIASEDGKRVLAVLLQRLEDPMPSIPRPAVEVEAPNTALVKTTTSKQQEAPTDGEEERPRRRKQRRQRRARTSDSEAQASVSVSKTSEHSESAPTMQSGQDASDENSQTSATAMQTTGETSVSPVQEESSAAPVPQDRPTAKRRKQRRSHKYAESEQKDHSAEDNNTQADKSSTSGNGRPRQPRMIPGIHAEFWEAWADDKGSTEANTFDDAPLGERDVSLDGADDNNNRAEPRKKRRRRRSRSETTEDTMVMETDDNKDSERNPASTRLFINVGKRETDSSDDIRSFLAEALGDDAEILGTITLRNTHSYVRVPQEHVESVIERCNGLSFHEREVVVERAKR